MDFQLPLSPPSFGFESHCQMELRFLPSVTHQKDNYLPSMTALMQDYSEKQRSGCLKEQISEPDHHPELPPRQNPGRALAAHLSTSQGTEEERTGAQML